MSGEVPVIDVSALIGAPGRARAQADEAIMHAAGEVGFAVLTGVPATTPLGAQAQLLRIFELPPSEMRRLWRRKFAPGNPNVYRGWFPVQPGEVTHKEGCDLGADVAYGPSLVNAEDPLLEATPMPPEDQLPGWHDQVAAYYRAMEAIGRSLLRSIARSFGLTEEYFDTAFHQSLSTLRLLRYPVRTDAELATRADDTFLVDAHRERAYVVGAAHTDSGFLTLLAQDGVPGLQARLRDGRWVDVPSRQDALVLNFGQVLEHWCGGRIRATEHRVIGTGQERHSVPFFYEARADARIAPLPIDAPDRFRPFLYGDFLWERMVRFVEFRGLEDLRPRRGA
jgi:isopenicillin N synthase-like dioxygenase